MKLYKLAVVIMLLIFASSVQFFAQDDSTPIALIKKIIKDVSYKTVDASDWEVAKTGNPLKSGEQVKTGFKSLALVLFTDGTGLLRVRENSTMYIYGEKSGKKTNKNTFIERGLIGFDVNKQDVEEFKFTTPTAVAAIRGTAGYLEVGADSSTTVVCDHGEIEVKSLVGEKGTETVSGGKALRIAPDGTMKMEDVSAVQNAKYSKSKKTKVKKVFIETEQGIIEFEFYPEEE